MSLFSTVSVRRSSEERSERNTYLAQQQSPVPTPFISPGDGIQYTKTPSCSSITPVPGIRAGLPGNWLVLDEHKVWDYPQRSGDYRKGWRDWESVMGVWCRGVRWLGNSLLQPQPLLHPAIPRPSAHVIYSHKNVSGLFIYLFIYSSWFLHK